MCKRKDILEKIKSFQTEVNFRLDYFARPGALDKIFACMPKEMEYFEYKPTEEEQQIIGLDDVSSCLNKSLTELLFDPCKVLKSVGGRETTIYIHRNFVSLQAFISSSDDNNAIVDFAEGILWPFLEETGINVEDISTRITFAKLNVASKDLWTVFDRTAFPVLDDQNVKVGAYQDTRQVDGLYIDLMRNFQINDDGTYDGVVSTNAVCLEEEFRGGIADEGLKGFLLSVISESIGEITRCFTEQ